MAPSPTRGPVFEETQWFYRRWWWLLLGLGALVLGPPALAARQPSARSALLVAGPLLLLLVGIGLLKLRVRVDAFGIHYHYPPLLNRWRHWPWQEFAQVFPRAYSPLGHYGGWGLRGLPGNLAYNVWGGQGLQLVFRSGNRLLLGTQQPTELRATLAALRAADATRPIALTEP